MPHTSMHIYEHTFEGLGIFEQIAIRMVDLQVEFDGLQKYAFECGQLLEWILVVGPIAFEFLCFQELFG